MKAPVAPAALFRRRKLQQIARALLLSTLSGGLLPLLLMRRIAQVARGARCIAGDAEVLLVPGCHLDDCEIRAPHAARLGRAHRLWRRDPARLLLLSGAAGHPQAPTEAASGLTHLSDLGLPPAARVLLDPSARDTEENLLNALPLLAGAGRLAPRVAVISNRWHLARCAWLAEQHGLPWRMVAAEHRWRPGIVGRLALAREALALLATSGTDALRLDPAQLLRLHRSDRTHHQ